METNFNIKFSNYGEFRNFLLKELEDFLPRDYMEHHVIRSTTIPSEQYSGGEGICFMDVRGVFDKDKAICPTLPIKHLYEIYKRSGFSHVVYGILNLISSTSNEVNDISNFELSEETVITNICSIEDNKDMLKNIPHRKIFNLAIYYMGKFKDDDESSFSTGFLITNQELDRFNITEQELFKYAMANGKNNYRLISFYNAVKDIPHENNYFCSLLGKKFIKNTYIVTNNFSMGGGSLIANFSVLKEIGDEIDDDFYIVPNTENEFIVFPYSTHKNKMLIQNLKNIFRNAVNTSSRVKLKDDLYLYKRSENNIFIYTE